MVTYREIEEEIAALEKAIEKLRKEISNDRDILFEYDEDSKWIIGEMKKEQAEFQKWDKEYWTIEYFVRGLADKKVTKAELDEVAIHLMASKMYEHIPKRYADQAVHDLYHHRGGDEADGEAAGSARTSPHEPVRSDAHADNLNETF